MGWRVIRVWECDIRAVAGRDAYLDRLYETITAPLLPSTYTQEPDSAIAAEPDITYGTDYSDKH